MKRVLFLLAFVAAVNAGCMGRFAPTAKPEKVQPKFGSTLLFPGAGSSGSGGGGSVTQGTSPWVTSIRDQGTLATVDYGDTTNKAARVNIVAGASSGAVAQGSTTSGQTGGLNQGAATTAAPTYSNGTTNPLSLDTAGSLRVNVTSGGTSGVVAQSTTTAGQSGMLNQGAVTTAAPSYTTGNTNPLSLTTAGALRTDSSATTQPVSGTVTANAGTNLNTSALALDTSVNALSLAQGSTTSGQKGVLHLGAVTTAAPSYTTAQSSPLSLTTGGLLRVDGSGATNTVTGTVTANIGTSGSLALDATVAKLTLAQGSTTSGQTGALTLCAVTTGAPSYTTAQSSPCSLTLAGALRMDGSAVTQPISAASLPLPAGASTSANQTTLGSQTTKVNDGTNTAAVKAASTAAAATDPALVVAISPNNTVPVSLAANQTVNVAQINGVTPLMGNGVTGTGSQRVTIASDNTAFAVTAAPTNASILSQNLDMTSGASIVILSTGTGAAGYGSIMVEVAGTGTGTIRFFCSESGTGRAQIMRNMDGTTPPSDTANAATVAYYAGTLSGCSSFSVGVAVVGTGTAVISFRATAGGAFTNMVTPLPVGSNTIGNVGVAQNSTTSGQSGPLMQATTSAFPPAGLTAGKTGPLSLDAGGGTLRVGMNTVVDAGNVLGTPWILQPEITEDFAQRTSVGNILDYEPMNHTAQNTAKHKVDATTMVPSHTTGFTTNSTNITTINTGAAFSTYQYFPAPEGDVNYAFMKVKFNGTAAATNTTVDWGFFTRATTTPYAPTDGVFFRNTSAGMVGVTNYNGTETSTASFKTVFGGGNFVPTAGTEYDTIVYWFNQVAVFWIDMRDGNGYTMMGRVNSTSTAGSTTLAHSAPLSVRHAIGGTVASAAEGFTLVAYQVTEDGIPLNRPWSETAAAMGLSGAQGISGGTMGSTAAMTNGQLLGTGFIPASNSAVGATGLGGLFTVQPTMALGTDGILSSFQNPASTVNKSGRTLIIDSVKITGTVDAVLAGGGGIMVFSLAWGHTAVDMATAEVTTFPNTKAPRRKPLGEQFLGVNAAAGSGGVAVEQMLLTDVAVQPGEFVAVTIKNIGPTLFTGTTGLVVYTVTYTSHFE